MVLTVYFGLSLVTGLCCHHRLRDHRLDKLDISVGISGPHDFAVRDRRIRLARRPRPPHPAPNVRDDRETPLVRGGITRDMDVIWAKREGKYFCAGDWTAEISLIGLTKMPFCETP
jgi:hypothetical protein